ncbi:MAG: tRNA (adenosine(37)-N6)-dimethylallyltransferase MiaA [Dehalococcoidia bacterium]|nr:tRNA (adenosine(37)-N6)-dimethylallyltransferase MiaA [Dehalococcoidia bacterium]
MKCLIAFVGPTAVGKSSVAVSMAQSYGGEIINADSRQIYKYMDIGTAKPGIAERESVPHHILDIICPDELYSVALYQRTADEIIKSIQGSGKLPFLVGGSGQYVWSVIEGWQIPEVKPDLAYRQMLEQESERIGANGLYVRLKELDPVAASKILPGNMRRVIRALEIYKQTGIKPSVLQVKKGVSYPVLMIGLTAKRDRLYEMINRRAENMISAGFVEEVQNLLKMEYSPELPAMSSLGYKQIALYLSGELSLDEAVQNIKYETHRFARSQYAWFKLKDSRIHWFDINDDISSKINYTIQTFLETDSHIGL